MAWDATIDPAPIAITTKTLPSGDANPMVSIRGTMMEAVVIIATVLAPMLSLKIQAMMNGTKIPRPVDERPWIDAWIGRALRIWPKAPPAPVMARIAALSVIDKRSHHNSFTMKPLVELSSKTPRSLREEPIIFSHSAMLSESRGDIIRHSMG